MWKHKKEIRSWSINYTGGISKKWTIYLHLIRGGGCKMTHASTFLKLMIKLIKWEIS